MNFCTARVAPEKAVFRPALPLWSQPEFPGEQTMAHGAIETIYKGYRFRSRLEARWAVFFDALKIEWKYELQGWEAGGYRYLPDFWLPQENVWVEVKGDPDGLRADIPRMLVMLGAGSPLPTIPEGLGGLLVLGDIPADSRSSVWLHPYFTRLDEQTCRGWMYFIAGTGLPSRPVFVEPNNLLPLFGLSSFSDVTKQPADSMAWDARAQEIRNARYFRLVTDAYTAARCARFEHGESGAQGRSA